MDAVGETRERIVMFHRELLLAAIQADRQREFDRAARVRQAREFNDRHVAEPQRRRSTIADVGRPAVRGTTAGNG